MHENQMLPILLTIKEQLGTLEAKVDGIRRDASIAAAQRARLEERVSSLEHSRTRAHAMAVTVGAIAGAFGAKVASFLGINI